VILFERTYEDGKRYSGDYAFCRKWRSLGGRIYVAPEMVFTHTGASAWAGSLGDFWRRKHGILDQRFTSALQALRCGQSSPEYFEQIYRYWGNPYSMPPAELQAVYEAAINAGGPILEVGAGVSTLVLAAAAEFTGGKLVSLENDMSWYTKVYADLRDQRLASPLRICELADYPEQGVRWYTLPPDDLDYALVVCDGPQRRHGRNGLFALLSDHIRDAKIIMDDTDDKRQLQLLQDWQRERGGTLTNHGRYAIYERKNV
jgi:hypothetical protein